MSAVVKGHAVAGTGARVAAAVLEARAEAARLLAVAEEEARAHLEAARAEAARLRQAAAAEGREAGLARASELLARALAERDAVLSRAEAELVELAFEIARRVVAEAASRDAVVTAASRALEVARARTRLTLRAHPADVAAVRADDARLAAALGAARAFAVVEDPSIERGGVVLETEAGAIDARLETQLGGLRRALLGEGARPPGEAP